MSRPTDAASVRIDGLYYKIGLRGMVFLWANGHWIRSSKHPSEILKYVRD
jgi:hypothetical protein